MDISITAITASRKLSKALTRHSAGISVLRDAAKSVDTSRLPFDILQVVFLDRSEGYARAVGCTRRGSRLFQVEVAAPDQTKVDFQDASAFVRCVIDRLRLAVELSRLPHEIQAEVQTLIANTTDEIRSGGDHGRVTRDGIRARIESLGFASTVEFCRARPSATFLDLAAALDPDTPPILVLSLLREDAHRTSNWDYFVKTVFVRQAHEHFPQGWMRGPNPDFKRARVYGSWGSKLEPAYDQQVATIGTRLKESDNIPEGWLPQDERDPVLTRLFAGLHFKSPQQISDGTGD
jgi:hypothetical protein